MRKHFFKKAVSTLAAAALATTLTVTGMTASITNTKAADTDEIMLGVFYTSEEDTTDTLYWSTDGLNFYELAQAYVDSDPNSLNVTTIKTTDADYQEYCNKYQDPGRAPFKRGDSTLHDPAIIYKDGYFYMLSGRAINGQLEFYIGYSKDLIRWNYPGEPLKIAAPGGYAGSDKVAAKGGNTCDMVAPDFFVDNDGSVYIVASLGYYAAMHGDDALNDVMQPYMIKLNNLGPGTGTGYKIGGETFETNIDTDKEVHVTGSLSDVTKMELPCQDKAHYMGINHIDGSLYKDGGSYYFSIKENGVTNELYKISSLAQVGNKVAWELVCDDVVTGYEGASLTKFAGQYFMYTDRLASYVPVDTDRANGAPGIYVTKASTATTGALDKYTGWLEDNTKAIKLYDANGNVKSAKDSGKTAQGTPVNYKNYSGDGIYNGARHGSVITVTGDAAAKVRAAAAKTKHNDTSIKYNNDAWSHGGWYRKESFRDWRLGGYLNNYWYENDYRQGVKPGNLDYRGKEIYDPGQDGWFWLDAKYDGKMGTAMNTYDNNGNVIRDGYRNGDYEVAQAVDWNKFNSYGSAVYGATDASWKWVRYDWYGKMVKCGDSDANRFYVDGRTGNLYRYDPITGAMVKGLWSFVNGNGDNVYVYFDPATGVLQKNTTIEYNGYSYPVDEGGGIMFWLPECGPIDQLPVINYEAKVGWEYEDGKQYWYEGNVRQGYDPANPSYRGKEIYDPTTDAWYWLDNVQQGAVAKSKDVYQESLAGQWGDIDRDGQKFGKWVRYDENGHMIKGWSADGRYYFDPVYGTMAKGAATIDGVDYYFDPATGIKQ